MAQLNTPYFLVDEGLLKKNLEILRQVQQEAGCKILLAQKAFSMFACYPLISRYLAGTTASGLYEARLGREEFPGEVHVFSPAYREEEFQSLLGLADHFVFNSPSQLRKYAQRAKKAGKQVGLRVNPECSTQEGHAIYDPCAPGSRLGTTLANFDESLLPLLDGLHFHTLCEQNSDDLETTAQAFEEKFGKYLPQMKWLNLGGGHHITRRDYDIPRLVRVVKHFQEKYGLEVYLEPGEAAGDCPQRHGHRHSGYLRRLPHARRAGDALPASREGFRQGGGEALHLPPGRSHLPGRGRHRGLLL